MHHLQANVSISYSYSSRKKQPTMNPNQHRQPLSRLHTRRSNNINRQAILPLHITNILLADTYTPHRVVQCLSHFAEFFIEGLSGDETTRRLGVGDSPEEVLVEGREEGAGVSAVEDFDCWLGGGLGGDWESQKGDVGKELEELHRGRRLDSRALPLAYLYLIELPGQPVACDVPPVFSLLTNVELSMWTQSERINYYITGKFCS